MPALRPGVVRPSTACKCTFPSCGKVFLRITEVRKHFKDKHTGATWNIEVDWQEVSFEEYLRANPRRALEFSKIADNSSSLPPDFSTPASSTDPPISSDETTVPGPANIMDDSSGRGRREKFPSARIKEHVVGKAEKLEDADKVMLPNYVAGNDSKLCAEPKEITKTVHHTKIWPNGQKFEFYRLSGPHVESKDRRYYVRAQRDVEDFYFHAVDAPPFYARISDENHQQCAADKTQSLFTKDMLGKTGEWGHYTSRANVFARQGTLCYEARIISTSDCKPEDENTPLALAQEQDITCTNRGNIRVGFCRREHTWSECLGANCYSYAVVSRGEAEEYGNARFNSYMQKVTPNNPGTLKIGDVIGLMITLPSLRIHKEVVEGTFNPADYPDLECGPATKKPKKQAGGSKKATKGKEKEDGTKNAIYRTDVREQVRDAVHAVSGHEIDTTHDILRDRNPFIHKDLVYFECPDYTPRPDLLRPATRGKTINPETHKAYEVEEDCHPQHELPQLRTLPGSKIEMWVNGKYKGIVAKHLMAFLPPASHIEASTKTQNLSGNVDDGLLGYYPAIGTYGGGAVEFKFDGKWWHGFDDGLGHPNPEARPFGARYVEQQVEDFANDLVDEIYHEKLFGDVDWMKKRVLNAIDLEPVKQSDT